MKTLSAFGSKVFLFCGVKNLLASKASGISRKDKLTHLFFFWGWYLGGCPTPCCPYAGVKKMEQVCAHVVLVRSYITLSLSFTSCPVSLFFPPSFPNLFFSSSPYPVSFVSSFFYPLPYSLSLSRCKFYSPSLLSFLPLLPFFLPSFLPSFLHRFPSLFRTFPPFICSSLLASTFACFIPHALSSCILNLCSFVCLFQHSPSSFFYHIIIVRMMMMMMMMMIIIVTITLNFYLSLFLFQYSSSLLPIVSNRTVLRTHSWLNSGRSK